MEGNAKVDYLSHQSRIKTIATAFHSGACVVIQHHLAI